MPAGRGLVAGPLRKSFPETGCRIEIITTGIFLCDSACQHTNLCLVQAPLTNACRHTHSDPWPLSSLHNTWATRATPASRANIRQAFGDTSFSNMLAGIASNRVNALRLAFATIGISAFIFIYFTAPDLFSSVSLPQFSAFTLSEEEIPNIVHFAHLIRPDNVTGIREIKFQFKHFVAIYSAHYHLNP